MAADRPAAGSGFDGQVRRLVDLGFGEAAGLSVAAFRARLEPLRDAFLATAAEETAAISPIIVLAGPLASPDRAIASVDRSDGRPGTLIGIQEAKAFGTLPSVAIPDGDAYLLAGVDLGDGSRGIPPADALTALAAAGRSPLTIDEGLALFAQNPGVVSVKRGISLAGSSRGDRRVQALWVSKGRPKLGWCYLGAPHSWLGTASCTDRVTS